MEFAYDRFDICILLDNLKNEVIRKTLAYMIDFKEQDNLVVIPKPHSIEISNADICIAVLVFSGFEKEFLFFGSQAVITRLTDFIQNFINLLLGF